MSRVAPVSFSRCPAWRSGFRGVAIATCPAPVVRPIRNSFEVIAKYRGLNTDLSRLEDFRKHENDSGSSAVQVARFSARVTQLTEHLKKNKHDYSTTYGLQKILGKRRRLLRYLYYNDREAYTKCIQELGIRFKLKRAAKLE